MSTKFEQLLDYLVNEETDKANELFHEIVVEKSREIYENLIAEEEKEEKMEEESDMEEDAVEEEADTEEEDDAVEESYTEEETVEGMFGDEEEEGGNEFPVQDKTDDFADDSEDPLAGGDEGGDSAAPADKGDIQDLTDALEELKAEFEALMAGEKHEEEENPDVHGGALDGMGDEEEADDEEGEEEGEEEEEPGNPFAKKGAMEARGNKSQGETMREYIEKISVTMTDGEGVGSGKGDLAGQTGHDAGKSPISSGSGKPQSGANAKNVAQAGKGSNEDGTSPKGKVGGLVKTGGDFVKSGTKNVAASANTKKPDGAKLTSVSKPSNAEGQPVGAGKGDKAGQTGSVDTNSPLNGAPNRAK